MGIVQPDWSNQCIFIYVCNHTYIYIYISYFINTLLSLLTDCMGARSASHFRQVERTLWHTSLCPNINLGANLVLLTQLGLSFPCSLGNFGWLYKVYFGNWTTFLNGKECKYWFLMVWRIEVSQKEEGRKKKYQKESSLRKTAPLRGDMSVSVSWYYRTVSHRL